MDSPIPVFYTSPIPLRFPCDILSTPLFSLAFQTLISLILNSYQLRVPSDTSPPLLAVSESDASAEYDGFTAPVNKPEFEVTPACATVMPFSKQKITVDFTSFRIKKYDLALVVDVDGVGRDMSELPIKADCRAPKVLLALAHSITTPTLP